MTNVLDVAQYILERQGPVTAMKLQKLVYYSQVWSIVWDDDVLFDDAIEAWKLGPVVRRLYDFHRGQFRVEKIGSGSSANLTDAQKATVDRVLKFYGDKSAQWLSDLTHLEEPWKKAWDRNHSGGNNVITTEDIAEYYGSLEAISQA